MIEMSRKLHWLFSIESFVGKGYGYEKEVFNGDIGRILRFNEEDKTVNVVFDGRSVEYQYAEFDEIELAYAMTVHKSQGSEYPIVVMILATQYYVMLQRNLVYTGLTRAKEGAMFVGSVKALGIAVGNDGVKRRYSGLSQRLTGSLKRIEGNVGLFDNGGM
jgi:exodeoxyribonuclease V alpha subunit